MNLFAMLQRRAAEGRPLQVGLIGAGKFGSMYLSQARRTPGVHLVGVADLAPERARASLARTGWEAQRIGAASFEQAVKTGRTHITDDAQALIIRFREYGLVTDESGRYSALYKPFHLIGLARYHRGIDRAAWRAYGRPRRICGRCCRHRQARHLKAGELLDGEGGYTVYGKLTPAAESLRLAGLPLGLAHGIRLRNPVRAGEPLRWPDVAIDASSVAAGLRREMEAAFAAALQLAA